MLNRRQFSGSLAAALWTLNNGSRLSAAASQLAHPDGPRVSFSVMIWTLKALGTFEQNLDKVAQAGYQHVEFVGEFQKWSEDDYRRITAKLQALGLTVDATSGMKLGFADPGAGDAYLAELKTLIASAKRLGCRQLILLSGKRLGDDQADHQHAVSIETLKRSAEVLEQAGMVAVIEPIDRIENPTIYLNGVTEAGQIARSVGSPNIKVLYDIYHEQRGLGNLIEKLEANIAEIGLIHIADVPGRHQPGTGEIDYGNIYRKLAQLRYRGVIAMEFYPTGDAVEQLRQAREEAQRAMA